MTPTDTAPLWLLMVTAGLAWSYLGLTVVFKSRDNGPQ